MNALHLRRLRSSTNDLAPDLQLKHMGSMSYTTNDATLNESTMEFDSVHPESICSEDIEMTNNKTLINNKNNKQTKYLKVNNKSRVPFVQDVA